MSFLVTYCNEHALTILISSVSSKDKIKKHTFFSTFFASSFLKKSFIFSEVFSLGLKLSFVIILLFDVLWKIFFLFRDAVIIKFYQRSSRRFGYHTSEKDNKNNNNNNNGIHTSMALQ
jgi:hypothetical protein